MNPGEFTLLAELKYIRERAMLLMWRDHLSRDNAVQIAVDQQMWMEEFDSPSFRDFLRKAA